jgi:hypothetical protein
MADHEDLFRELVDEPIEPGHMESMLAGAENRAAIQNQRQNNVTVSTLLAAMVLVSVLAIPVSYEQKVGVRASFEWPRSLADVDYIEAELSRLEGMVARKTALSGDKVFNTVVFRGCSEEEAAMRVRSVIRDIFPADTALEIEAHSIVRKIKGNVLAALSQGHFQINAQGFDDHQIEQAILQELGLMGVTDPEVSVTRPEEGGVLIDVWTADSPVDSFTFEVKF